MSYSIKCKNCGIQFTCANGKRQVCSRKCYAEYRSKVYRGTNHGGWIDGRSSELKVCPICNNKFVSVRKQRCCSPTCKGKYYSSSGIKAGKFNGMYKGGRIKAGHGYIKVLLPEHPYARRRYVLEHRLVMEKYIGRYLKPNEVVHHINEITNDNRIENLQLMTNKEHDKLHCIKNKKIGVFVRRKFDIPIELKCQYCGGVEKRHYFRPKMTCKKCQVLQQKERGRRWELKQKLNS